MKVLIVCGQNSCRSQMAEGLVRALCGEKIEVFSAGLAAGGVNRMAVETMAEIGIDISHHTSDVLDVDMAKTMDVLVTVCAEADKHCPVIGGVDTLRWPVDDPAVVEGSEEEVKEAFRRARDRLKEYVVDWLVGLTDKEMVRR